MRITAGRSTPRRLPLLAACLIGMAAAGCADSAAPVAAGAVTDLAGTASPGLGTPLPVPVDARFDGAYAGTLAPAAVNPPSCGATPDGLPRTMLVSNGRATLGVNLPFDGLVEPDGHVTLTYLAVGSVTGQFAGNAFRGVLQTEVSGRCRWAMRLVQRQTARPGRAGESPGPALVPGPRSLLDQATPPGRGGRRLPGPGE